MKRGLLALAALVAVLVGAFVAWGGGTGGVERSSSAPQDTASDPTEAVTADALAASPAVPAPSERRALDARFAPVAQSVATSGGARRWSELLAPIDISTRAPVADATLVFFDARGTRRERPLDGPIDQRDLLPGVLGVVDAPNHVARPFLPNDFASHAPGPLTVELRPSAALHIVADVSIDLSQGPIEYSIESGYDGRATGSDEDRAAIDVSRRLRELLHSDLDPSARAQRVAALTVRREPAALALFDLARTPDPSFGAQARLTLPDRLPWVIDDLPTGVQVDVQMRLAGGLRVGRGGDFAALKELRSLHLEPASTRQLVLERDLFGTVRGRLDDFATGHHALWFELEGAAPNLEQRTFAARPSGEFQIEFVMPGPQVFNAYWTTTRGTIAEYTLAVEIPADGILDLGVLRTDAELVRHALTVRPRVTIDGLEVDVARDERLRGSSWTVELRNPVRTIAVDDGRPLLRRSSAPLSDEVVIDDLLPGRYELTMASEHEPRLDRLVLALEKAERTESIRFTADAEHVVDVALRSLWRTTFRFVHDGASPLPPLDFSVRRRSRSAIGSFHDVAIETAFVDGATREYALDEGSWIAEVRTSASRATGSSTASSQRLVAWCGFDVGETDESVVEIQLVAACTLELARAIVDAHPEEEPYGTHEFLRAVGVDHDRRPLRSSLGATFIVFEDLLPDTEYTIVPLDRKFRTGAPGSVTRIDR